ncbi:Cytochrome P450 [Quillaja saponaria]|uniref:Cytochrome P450 n=1 Tax=Quillaja saponaria TaxID=32244 RepID=A0AAD7VFG3_QUISA|nr:Cytochrome P450 [Quillaja saponaria]
MSPTIFLVLFLIFIYIARATLLRRKQSKNDRKQPPGPLALPIIGNLHILGKLPHRTLHSLAQKYGPVMSLRLGHVPTIVVSSPEAAESILKTHDAVCANRPKVQAAEYISYGAKGMAFTEFGPYWRSVRKLCNLELLSVSKVESYEPLRRDELGLLVKSLRSAALAHEIVDLSGSVGGLTENITCKLILGRSKDDRFDLKGLIREGMNLLGAFNAADYLPLLGAIDLQGLTRRLKKASKALDQVLEKIIDDHNQVPIEQKVHQNEIDFVDRLLLLMDKPINPQDDQIHIVTRTNIKAILFDMIVGAYETSAVMLDWAFSELLKHPRVMKNVQDELENVIGMNKMVEETDLEKLNYLEMVIKETSRLHPVAPLLVPHESMEDITFNGHYIKKNSRIIVNAWSIGHDPKVWSDNVDSFYPERFIDSNIDLRGHDFQLIPFGSGRRGCPGMQFGLTTVKLVLAQLIHCFNWELPYGLDPHHLDMEEKYGLSLPRAKHLLAVPTYRLF